jgi:hypothetical protein
MPISEGVICCKRYETRSTTVFLKSVIQYRCRRLIQQPPAYCGHSLSDYAWKQSPQPCTRSKHNIWGRKAPEIVPKPRIAREIRPHLQARNNAQRYSGEPRCSILSKNTSWNLVFKPESKSTWQGVCPWVCEKLVSKNIQKYAIDRCSDVGPTPTI